MKLIVGLGNPGGAYQYTRHNAGFLFLNTLVSNFKLEKKFKAEIAKGGSGKKKIIYAKPQTFMNNSGTAVQSLLQYYKLQATSLLVVHDEVDLPLGKVKLTKNSSSAGHNGVKSVIEALGTKEFLRIRIGIETRTSRDEPPTDPFVLQLFTEKELALLKHESFPEAKKLLDAFMTNLKSP